jgi:hypothetical protein
MESVYGFFFIRVSEGFQQMQYAKAYSPGFGLAAEVWYTLKDT